MAKPTKESQPNKVAIAKANAKADAASAKPSPEAKGSVAFKTAALLDRVAERTGRKKQDLKPIIEATLAELGEALSRGEAFVLEPLGRGKVNRSKAVDGGETLVVKLKRSHAKAKPSDKDGKKEAAAPLASDED